MWMMLLISIAVFFVSVQAARSSELHRFMWEENRKSRLRAGYQGNEEEFMRAMRAVFWVMAGTSALIGVLAVVGLLAPTSG